GLSLRRLLHWRCGGAFEAGLGFYHLHVDGLWQLAADGLAFKKLDRDLKIKCQVVNRVAQNFARDMYLIIGFSVHEVEVIAIAIEEFHLGLVYHYAVYGVAGAKAMLEHGAGAQV